jgi:DhnA family fructose-bisphosphate aldolase class Ia
MSKTDKATTILKLLKKGYSPKEITERVAVSYNYAWKLKKDLEAAAQEVLTATGVMGTTAMGYVPKPEPEADTNVDAILNERANTYGSFVDVAKVAQQLKHVAASHTIAIGAELSHDKIEALEMIFSKIARIINGNPDQIDSWIDIAGYATLVADRLKGEIR